MAASAALQPLTCWDRNMDLGEVDYQIYYNEHAAPFLRVRPGTHDARAMRRIRTMAAAA